MPTDHDPFAHFEPNTYSILPNLNLQTTIQLALSLVAVAPELLPAYVKLAAARMLEVAEEAEEERVDRLRAINGDRASGDAELDLGVDPLWSLLRERLKGWSAYTRPGLDFLAHDLEAPEELDLELLRDRAERGAKLSRRLFGKSGLSFTNFNFVEQGRHTGTLLKLIDTDGLEADLLELAGPELLPALRRCQVAYERMLEARGNRINRASADLRKLRARLRRAISRYASAVMTLLDEDEPGTLSLVEGALQPIPVARLAQGRSVSSEGPEVAEGAEVAEGPEPVEAESESPPEAPPATELELDESA